MRLGPQRDRRAEHATEIRRGLTFALVLALAALPSEFARVKEPQPRKLLNPLLASLEFLQGAPGRAEISPQQRREITGSNGERGSAHASKGCGVRTGGDGDVVSSLSWLLFPAAVTAIMSFFLERIAATVEALDYPGRGPPRRQRIGETIASTLRLTGLTLLLNLLALPVYLLVPGINLYFSSFPLTDIFWGGSISRWSRLDGSMPRRPERRATVLVSAYSSGGHDRSTIQPAAC